MSTSSHLLKGLHFNIKLELDSNDISRSSLNVIEATLNRHRRQPHNSQTLPSLQFLNKISQNLDIRYRYLQIDFDKATYLTSNAKTSSVQYSELIIKQSNKTKSKEKLSFFNSLRFFPECNTDLSIEKDKVDFVIKILQGLKVEFSDDEILVISGEMIWGRYINSQELLNIIIKAFKAPRYILIDYYGIWQSLVNKDIKKLKNINKKYLLPQLLKLSVESSKKSIEILKDSPRNLLLINNNNLFNLTDGPYYLKDSLVPEWLLITKEVKNKQENNFIQISQDLSRDYPISISYYSQSEIEMPQISITFKAGIDQKCIKKVGEWVDVNETIGSYSELEFTAYNFHNQSEIKVFDGQLVKKGDLLFNDRKGNKAFAPYQAKSDLKLVKYGILRLIRQSITRTLEAPFRGHLEGFSNTEGYSIGALNCTLFPFDFVSGVNVIGYLSEAPEPGSIYYCKNYTDFMKIYGGDRWSNGKYFKDQLKAIIINSLNFADFEKIEKLSKPYLNIGIIDIGRDDSEIEFLKRFLGKQVVLTSQGLVINREESLGIYENDEDDKPNARLVKALDLDGRLVYGKIISKSTNNSNTVLISSDRGYSECHLSNIIQI